MQAVRLIVPAQTAPARVRVLTRNIVMLQRKKLGLNTSTVFTIRRPALEMCPLPLWPNRHAFARARPGQ